jgi:hypothetical protein
MGMSTLVTLPEDFVTTRESLRSLACYVLAPAYKARTGRIGLRPFAEGFGTRPFDDGVRLVVRGDELAFQPGPAITITTVAAAAEFAGVTPMADPGVGHDLPPFAPEAALAVGRDASLALGRWYGLGQRVFDGFDPPAGAEMSEAQLWPEHFDYAVTVTLAGGARVNVGFSPGDGFEPTPYVYVGPHVTAGLDDPYWNAPFGAFLPYAEVAGDAEAAAAAFIREGLDLLG